jgi:hypothetical protein
VAWFSRRGDSFEIGNHKGNDMTPFGFQEKTPEIQILHDDAMECPNEPEFEPICLRVGSVDLRGDQLALKNAHEVS